MMTTLVVMMTMIVMVFVVMVVVESTTHYQMVNLQNVTLEAMVMVKVLVVAGMAGVGIQSSIVNVTGVSTITKVSC